MRIDTLINGSVVPFEITKYLTYKKKLGSGGTGETLLFYDETADSYFAIKKYSPADGNDKDDCFKRFIEEIKILYKVNNPNIVRVFNYYLYPRQLTGFIQMEYVEGTSIGDFAPTDSFGWNELFIQAIQAFVYLESIGILHRDIRPSNFLIGRDNNLKVIDFGFGKDASKEKVISNSLGGLNWPVATLPQEFQENGEYNFTTEVYFLGNMFKNLVKDSPAFSYNQIVAKMCEVKSYLRYKHFQEVYNDISENLFSQIRFTDGQKDIYQTFANALIASVSCYEGYPHFETNPQTLLESLSNVIKTNALETTLQRNDMLIECFLSKDTHFRYYPKSLVQVKDVHNFYQLLKSLPQEKLTIVISNIINRLGAVKVKGIVDDDLPF